MVKQFKKCKKRKGITYKQIANVAKIPESTVKRIFSGYTDNPYLETLKGICYAVGLSLDRLFDESCNAKSIEIPKIEHSLTDENRLLKATNAALLIQIVLLSRELKHKSELLSLHNYYKNKGD